jgi:hypothetical protein
LAGRISAATGVDLDWLRANDLNRPFPPVRTLATRNKQRVGRRHTILNPRKETMKTVRTNTPDPQLRQQLDAKIKRYDEAFNKNDAGAVAAFLHRGCGFRDGQGTDLRSGGHRETFCRRVPERAFQQPCNYGRSGFPSRYRYGWQSDVGYGRMEHRY